MKWKGYGRKCSWYNLGYCPDICLESPDETHKHPQYSRSLSRDSNPDSRISKVPTTLARNTALKEKIRLPAVAIKSENDCGLFQGYLTL